LSFGKKPAPKEPNATSPSLVNFKLVNENDREARLDWPRLAWKREEATGGTKIIVVPRWLAPYID
jgi:hypothetical protein